MSEQPTMAADHPEAFCQRCGRPNVWSWHAPSPLWNAVMRDAETGADRFGIVCPPCFAELAEAVIGFGHVWHFTADGLDVAALWADPDGLQWDAAQCMWIGAKGGDAEPPLAELLDLIEQLIRYLRTSSSEELPGEMALKRRARATVARLAEPDA